MGAEIRYLVDKCEFVCVCVCACPGTVCLTLRVMVLDGSLEKPKWFFRKTQMVFQGLCGR